MIFEADLTDKGYLTLSDIKRTLCVTSSTTKISDASPVEGTVPVNVFKEGTPEDGGNLGIFIL